MELINQTSLPACLSIGKGVNGTRRGFLVAKATFAFSDRGEVELDDESPLPVLEDRVQTPLGYYPRDTDARPDDDSVDLAVLGAAYSDPLRDTDHQVVELHVGARSWRLLIHGDRRWLTNAAGDAVISAPAPFQRMPLVWDRAFGGTAEVSLDPHTTLPVQWPLNPDGVGFDASGEAAGLAAGLGSPEGYPKVSKDRLLPNVEDPTAPITSWNDQPTPVGWSPPPPTSMLISHKVAHGYRHEWDADVSPLQQTVPELSLQAPPLGEEVQLIGCSPHGTIRFRFPRLSVTADYTAGPRTGALPLREQLIVLLPEEQRFTVTYRSYFQFEPVVGEERSLRLRVGD